MPPRALAASLVAVLVPLGAGCGVGGGGNEDDVRAVVKSYIGASLDGNGRQACAFYTRELRAAVRREEPACVPSGGRPGHADAAGAAAVRRP